MQFESFQYDVKAWIVLSAAEVEVIERMCLNHYDSDCKALARQGGTVYGWKNQIHWAKDQGESSFKDDLTTRQVDLLCKVCEGAQYSFPQDEEKRKLAIGLSFQFRRLLSDMNDEWRKVNAHHLDKNPKV